VQVACTINYDRKGLWKKAAEFVPKFRMLKTRRGAANMTLQEKILYHQIHPLKLAADIGCEPVSLYLFWHHKLLFGLATHFVPPIAASVWLIPRANLESYKNSAAGAYLRRNMTRTIEGIRLVGDLLMAVGAWIRLPSVIILGAAIIVLAWTSGLIRKGPMSEKKFDRVD
jgi:hypothetical protein